MKKWCAESTHTNFGSTFEARDWDEAKEICDKNNWILLGEVFDTEMVDIELEAMIYRSVFRPTIH